MAENAPQLATVPYIGVTTDDRFDFISLGSHNGLNSPLTNLTRLSYTTRSWKTQARSFALLLYEIGEARIACLYLVNTTGGLLFTSILTFVAGQQQRPDDVFLLKLSSLNIVMHYALLKRGLCHGKMSLRLSVSRCYCVETAEHILKLFSPSGTFAIPVYSQTLWQYRDFEPISRCISEMIQDTATVNIHCESKNLDPFYTQCRRPTGTPMRSIELCDFQ